MMEKLNTYLQMKDAEYLAFRQNRIEAFKKDAYIQNFLMKHGLKEDVLDHSFRIFNEVYTSRLLCQNCKSLNECSQKSKGQCLALAYDHILFNEIEYCAYLKAENNSQAYLKNYIYSDIPEDLKGLLIEDLMTSTNDKALLFALTQIIKGENKGLYIYGDMGVGKTYHTIAFLNSLAKRGKDVAFVKTNDFINKARKLVINDPEAFEELVQSLKMVSYLVLDDIGSESVSSFGRDDLLFDILDYRMEHHKLTLFTSNHDLTSLLEHYAYDKKERQEQLKARRLLERIEVLAKTHLMTGKNRRQKA